MQCFWFSMSCYKWLCSWACVYWSNLRIFFSDSAIFSPDEWISFTSLIFSSILMCPISFNLNSRSFYSFENSLRFKLLMVSKFFFFNFSLRADIRAFPIFCAIGFGACFYSSTWPMTSFSSLIWETLAVKIGPNYISPSSIDASWYAIM